MPTESGSRQPPAVIPGGAAAGGGIVAAILQDHALGWAIVVAFTAWLIRNMVIAWLSK
jgi:hypothetical protein